MTAPSPQPNGHGLTLHPSRRLLGLRFAMAAFGCDEDAALAKIESGEIPWAFNIGSGSRLRHVRILRESLPGFSVQFGGLEEVISRVIPPSRTTLRAGERCAWWDCGHDLIARLVRNGLLAGQVEGHTLEVKADSARRFLADRRLA